MTNATETAELEAPRRITHLYGEPVAEYGTETEYWECYSPKNAPTKDRNFEEGEDHHLLFVAHYVRKDGDWFQKGLDRHHVKNLFNFDGWPTN